MYFQTPQFIEIEDKIFGPLTLKQFVYLAGAGGLSFTAYSLLPLPVAILLIAPAAALGAALAFYKINNKPFIHTLEASFRYLLGAKLYLWRQAAPKQPSAARADRDAHDTMGGLPVPKLSESKLKDLAWSLDVKDLSAQRRM
jgi:hypothetical protein